MVRRAILMDAAGRPVVSPITEDVQLRRYVSVWAGGSIDFDGSTQQVAEFQLTRRGLLQGTVGLRHVRKDEAQFAVIFTQGMDARMPAQSPTDESTSVFRLSKGDDAVLIFIGSFSDGRISTLRTAPDREYAW